MENVSHLAKMFIPVDWLFSMVPLAASKHAQDLDYLYWFLIITTGILFLLVIVPLGLILVRYRRRHPGQRALSQKDHNFWLESLWTFLPFIYLAVLFVWGFQQFLATYVAPEDSKELRIIGQKWSWSIDYPKEEINVAGVGAEVVVPVGQPVKLVMSSQDVIHSFYIPNLRIKQDVLPGRYTTLWFQADVLGEYPILCAEYCGDLHSGMLARLKVVPEDVYQDWVEEIKSADQALPLPELGQKLYTKLGCSACHSNDGSPRLAPSFKNVYGKHDELVDGSKILVDDDRIRNKLMNPTLNVTKGFAPVMPSFQGRVNEREISGLIAYIKSLKD